MIGLIQGVLARLWGGRGGGRGALQMTSPVRQEGEVVMRRSFFFHFLFFFLSCLRLTGDAFPPQ